MQAVFCALNTFDFSGMTCSRIFHGRGQCYPELGHINIDWFQPLVLITLYEDLPEQAYRALQGQIQQLPDSVTCVLLQRRYLRNGPIDILRGELPKQAFAREAGLRYELSFGSKQNIGFFMDMSPGRRWLQRRCEGKRVLNLFAYTCAFSVVAMAAGAHSVSNVDMSKAALATGRRNHQHNDQQAALKRDVQFLPHDLFRSWGRLVKQGPYDIVVIDPPSRQKGSFMAEQDYLRVVRRLPDLLPNGGDVLACLNAPELAEDFLQGVFQLGCDQAQYITRLENRQDFPESDLSRSVKMLHFYLPPGCSRKT